jgi:hypothetical protein
MEDDAMAVVRLVFDRQNDRDDGGLTSRKRIGHRLLFADNGPVETAARQLQRQRFDVEVRRYEDGRCTIVAAHAIAPTSAVMDQVTEFFEDLAQEHAAEYGGWVVLAEDI